MNQSLSSFAPGVILAALWSLAACSPPPTHDVILRGGTVYDGSGGEPFVADIAIDDDTIAAIGNLDDARAELEINVEGLAIAPGFINMLSWANVSLINDGRSQSDIRQGVTLEVMGEGNSMGPLNAAMKQELIDRQSDIRYDVEWTTLGEYLDYLVKRGISTNVASFIGAATPRKYVIGYEDRAATAEELEQMQQIVRDAMQQGAMGVASSLMYPPGLFADTAELIALSQAAAEFDGMYISHMRDEGAHMLEAIEELITIAREARIRAEIFWLDWSGAAVKRMWPTSLPSVSATSDSIGSAVELFSSSLTRSTISWPCSGPKARACT